MNKVNILLIAFVLTGIAVKAQVNLLSPRCERRENPLGIDIRRPSLSWLISGKERGIVQTHYHILVASSADLLAANQGDLWDSGKTASPSSVNVIYDGKALRSRMSCYWKVKVWTNKGETPWTMPAYWSMGLLYQSDWKGHWIGMDHAAPGDVETQFSRLSARYLRKEFRAGKTIRSATAYIIGLGLYELYINGHKIGDQVLAPGPTDYNESVKYNTFDVTAAVQQGKNTIGTILGNGRFYTMRQAYKPYKIKTFGYPKLLLNLDIRYSDGTTETISTDDSWKITANGPVRSNNEYDGEDYDATKEMPGWCENGFKDQAWQKAGLVQEATGRPVAQINENMKVMETIRPVSLRILKPDVYVLDMGQNMAGWLKIAVAGRRGQQVQLRFAETLQADGSLFTRNLRDAIATDTYVLKGGSKETWEPRFVYHGFRYVEITGLTARPFLADFEGRVVYDEMETSGTFTTSNPTLNSICKNAAWGIKSNYKGMPVDCPQRNERQPWLGDRTTGAYGESFLFDNGRLYTKWLDDIEESQRKDGSIPDVAPAFWRYYSDNVTWPATYLTVADMLYRQYGDERPIVRHYPSMKKWMDYMAERYSSGNIITKDKYGDWCVPPESKELIFSKDPARKTDGQLIATAMYYKLLELMQEFAELQHLQADADRYGKMRSGISAAFNTKFLNRATSQYSNNSVTANLLPLSFGLVPSGTEKRVFQQITNKIERENQGHISTGVIGTQWLMRGLSAYGRSDLAYRLAGNTSYPSWGYMVSNGATTIWELWNGNTADPSMNSQNHVMLLGDLLIWYYENLAGIRAGSPGFSRLQMKPEVITGLSAVNAAYRSVYGEIRSSWTSDERRFRWQIVLPPNTSATVSIPAATAEQVTEGGTKLRQADGVRLIKTEDRHVVVEIGSGTYQFEVKNKKQ